MFRWPSTNSRFRSAAVSRRRPHRHRSAPVGQWVEAEQHDLLPAPHLRGPPPLARGGPQGGTGRRRDGPCTARAGWERCPGCAYAGPPAGLAAHARAGSCTTWAPALLPDQSSEPADTELPCAPAPAPAARPPTPAASGAARPPPARTGRRGVGRHPARGVPSTSADRPPTGHACKRSAETARQPAPADRGPGGRPDTDGRHAPAAPADRRAGGLRQLPQSADRRGPPGAGELRGPAPAAAARPGRRTRVRRRLAAGVRRHGSAPVGQWVEAEQGDPLPARRLRRPPSLARRVHQGETGSRRPPGPAPATATTRANARGRAQVRARSRRRSEREQRTNGTSHRKRKTRS